MESSDDDSSDSDDPLDLIQANGASTPEPTSFRQSQQCSDADLWQKACEEEMERHTDSMALEGLSSYHLGSVQLAPDGS